MPRFSANLGHLFTEYPLIERIGAAAKAGFKAIELQQPYEVAPADVKAEIGRHGLTMLNINSPPGPGGEPGLAAAAGREREFDALCEKALDYVTAIGGTSIHLLAGIVPPTRRLRRTSFCCWNRSTNATGRTISSRASSTSPT